MSDVCDYLLAVGALLLVFGLGCATTSSTVDHDEPNRTKAESSAARDYCDDRLPVARKRIRKAYGRREHDRRFRSTVRGRDGTRFPVSVSRQGYRTLRSGGEPGHEHVRTGLADLVFNCDDSGDSEKECFVDVYLDGEKLTSMKPTTDGQVALKCLPAGRHELKIVSVGETIYRNTVRLRSDVRHLARIEETDLGEYEFEIYARNPIRSRIPTPRRRPSDRRKQPRRREGPNVSADERHQESERERRREHQSEEHHEHNSEEHHERRSDDTHEHHTEQHHEHHSEEHHHADDDADDESETTARAEAKVEVNVNQRSRARARGRDERREDAEPEEPAETEEPDTSEEVDEPEEPSEPRDDENSEADEGRGAGSSDDGGSTSDVISDEAFRQLKSRVEKASFKDEKVDIVEAAAEEYYFTTTHVVELLEFYDFKEGRVAVATTLYSRTVDQEHYNEVVAALTFESSKKKVRKELGL